MLIGTGAVAYRKPGDLRPTKALYEEAIETAVEAEAMGFDFVWTSEHHFEDDQWNPSPLFLQTAIAMRTSTLGLGTNVIQAPFYHPIRLAEDVATLDILSGGRMTLTAGTGSAEHEFATYNIDQKERHGRTVETLKIVQGMYDHEVYDHDGKYFSFPNIRLTTRPMQRRLPIFMAAHGPKNMRRAGREGFGINVQPAFAWHLNEYYEGLAEGGHDIGSVNVCMFGNMGIVVASEREADEIREEAQAAAGAAMAAYNARRSVASGSFDAEGPLAERSESMGERMTGPIGTPDQVLKELERDYKSSKVTHAFANGIWGKYGSKELWIKEVAPILRTWGRDPVGTEVPEEKVRPNLSTAGMATTN